MRIKKESVGRLVIDLVTEKEIERFKQELEWLYQMAMGDNTIIGRILTEINKEEFDSLDKKGNS